MVLVQELEDFLGNRVEITTADILYRQLEVPLNRIVRVMKLMLVFTLAAGVTNYFNITLYVDEVEKKRNCCFYQYGKKKTDIFMQVLWKRQSSFCLSVFGACVIGSGMAGIMKNCSWKKIRQFSYQFPYKQGILQQCSLQEAV